MTPKGKNGDVESFKAYLGFMIPCLKRFTSDGLAREERFANNTLWSEGWLSPKTNGGKQSLHFSLYSWLKAINVQQCYCILVIFMML